MGVVQTVFFPTSGVGGTFDLKIGNYPAITVQPGYPAATLQSMLASNIPSLTDVIVTKPSTLAHDQLFQITFLGLQYVGNVPAVTMPTTAIAGDNAAISLELLNTGGSLPVYNVTLPVGSNQFNLTWNGVIVGNFDQTTTAAQMQTELALYSGFAFVQVQKLVSSSHTQWLVIVVPQIVAGVYALDSLKEGMMVMHTSARTSVVSLIVPEYPLTDPSASLGLTFNNAGCYEDNGGVHCATSLTELSAPTSLPPSPEELATSIQTLRDVNKVLITRKPLPVGLDATWGFIVQGYQYTITYLETTSDSTYSAVTDLNEFSWTPPVATARILQEGPSNTVESLNIGQILSRLSAASSGWVSRTATVTEGQSVDTVGTSVPVSVSLNGQDFSDSPIEFAILATPTVTGILPTHGPRKGLTEVVVYGTGFKRSSLLSCRFGIEGDMIVPAAHFFNSSAILCISPPNNGGVAKMFVTVSNIEVFSGDNVSPSETVFTYDEPVSIDVLQPPLAPVSGNVSVIIIGGPFVDTDELRCKFGRIAVQAFFMNEGKIRCFAPPHPPGVYPLEVTINDQDYTTSRRTFFFYADPALSRIAPVAGPADSGSTQVSIFGTGFVNTTLLTCRFGGTTTPGIYVSSNYITCLTPPLDIVQTGGLSSSALSEQFNQYPDPANAALNLKDKNRLKLFPTAHNYPLYKQRLVAVEVSNNNQDFTNSGINYLYQSEARVDVIRPNSGQVNTRTPIVVEGENFVNSTLLRCRIGEYVSVPTFLAPNLVLCFTPRIPLITYDHAYIRDRNTISINTPQSRAADTSPANAGPNVVYVEVANNGQDFTNSKKTFTFNIKCESGYYCPQNNFIACPPGTYCPGEFNANVSTTNYFLLFSVILFHFLFSLSIFFVYYSTRCVRRVRTIQRERSRSATAVPLGLFVPKKACKFPVSAHRASCAK